LRAASIVVDCFPSLDLTSTVENADGTGGSTTMLAAKLFTGAKIRLKTFPFDRDLTVTGANISEQRET
jgi:hypothetical protein